MSKTLLLAEDDPHIRLLVGYALGRLGCVVESHGDGGEVLKRLEQPPLPDLVILDIHLPSVGGFDVLTAMKADSHLAKIPVLLLSASALESHREQARRLGAVGFIEKPFDVFRFTDVVERTISAPRD